MIDEITQYLNLNGFDAEVQGKRILINHLCDERRIVIAGEISSLFPRILPDFYLCERKKYGSLAHVGWDTTTDDDEGLICEGIHINRNIDYSSRNEVFIESLKRALDTVIKSLSDDEYNRREIINEFTAHWRHSCLNNNNKILSFIEPKSMVEEIEVYKPIKSSKANMPFLIKGQAEQINREYKFLDNLIKKSQSNGKAVYIPINIFFLPPNPMTDIKEWWFNLLKILPYNVQNQLKDIARRNHSRNFWVLGSIEIKPNSHGWFCILFKNQEKDTPPLFVTSNISAWEVEAFDVKTHIKEYIIPRGGSVLPKKKNTIAIVGCGSVGAEIGRQIGSSGIDNIILVDFDNLSMENIYRHFLSPEHIGRSKSAELVFDLKNRYPYSDITIVPEKNCLSSCLDSKFLNSVDGIIIATGSPTEERYFNEQIMKEASRPWIIYCWVEGHGVGGHAVYVHNSGKGCLNCLYRDNNGNKSLESIQNFLTAQQNVAIDLSGCGTQFLPYSFTDAIQTAILATRLSLLAINGKLSESCRMSWKNEYSNEMKLEITHRYKAFNNSLNKEPLYWEYCDVCNR
jgi:hypothetical protein